MLERLLTVQPREQQKLQTLAQFLLPHMMESINPMTRSRYTSVFDGIFYDGLLYAAFGSYTYILYQFALYRLSSL